MSSMDLGKRSEKHSACRVCLIWYYMIQGPLEKGCAKGVGWIYTARKPM